MIDAEVVAELVAMARRDQEIRRAARDGWAAVDHANEIRLKQIVDAYGWPTVSRAGPDAEHAAWLLVQHARDIVFQKGCLELMRAASHGDVCAHHLAYLEDRINVRESRPQRFGTQLTSRDGRFEPLPLADPEHVDALRAGVGIGPLAEYLRAGPRVWGRRVGAAAVITDERGRVLLVRHTYGERNWEIPGGVGEEGESADATAVREVREETGLEVATERLAGIYWEPAEDMHHFVFRCRRTLRSEPRADMNENDEVRWCDRTTLPRPISDFTVRRIDDALDGTLPAVHEIGPRTWIR